MEKMDITFERLLSIWWAFAWRGVVVGMLVGALLGFVGGGIFGAFGRADLAAPVGALLGWLGSIPVSIWALKAALAKQYSGYSLSLFKAQ